VVCRLLNSRYEPRRMIRAIGLPLELQEGLQTCVEQIMSAHNMIDLSYAHGRALGPLSFISYAKTGHIPVQLL
jgi:hypothetical protein